MVSCRISSEILTFGVNWASIPLRHSGRKCRVNLEYFLRSFSDRWNMRDRLQIYLPCFLVVIYITFSVIVQPREYSDRVVMKQGKMRIETLMIR